MTMKFTPLDPSLVNWDLFGDFAGEVFDFGIQTTMMRPATREWFKVEFDETSIHEILAYPRGSLIES